MKTDLRYKLTGLLPAKELALIRDSVSIRFKDPENKIMFKESLIIYEQNLLPEPQLREIMTEYYEMDLVEVQRPFITEDVIAQVARLKNLVPVEVDTVNNIITVGTLPERMGRTFLKQTGTMAIQEVPITLYDYVRLHERFYGMPDFIMDYPVRDLFNYVISEAIYKRASDITFAEKKDGVQVYFNINKRKVYSNRLMPKAKMGGLFSYITSASNAATSFSGKGTIVLSLDLDEHYRGRTVINKTYFGWTTTIRLLPNKSMTKTLRELSLPEDAIEFILRNMANQTPGLKLFVGPTLSGKNTTILSALYTYIQNEDCKVVSVEQPVEIIANFIEQINCDTDDDYEKAVDSLLRQNPDIIYITEMTDRTASGTLKTANTAKSVLSTLHSNGVADVIARIHDLTEMSYAQIIQIIDSIFYQQLLPRRCVKCDDQGCPDCYKAGMIPVCEYLQLNETFKRELMAKPVAEIYNTMTEWMRGKTKADHAMELLRDGTISRRTYENYIGQIK